MEKQLVLKDRDLNVRIEVSSLITDDPQHPFVELEVFDNVGDQESVTGYLDRESAGALVGYLKAIFNL